MKIQLAGLTAVLLFASTPTFAHHAFAAEFDADKPFVVKGEVTKIKWVNPHSWLYFDVKDADGTVTNWGVEFGTPNQLASKGLAKADLTVGSVDGLVALHLGFAHRDGVLDEERLPVTQAHSYAHARG